MDLDEWALIFSNQVMAFDILVSSRSRKKIDLVLDSLDKEQLINH